MARRPTIAALKNAPKLTQATEPPPGTITPARPTGRTVATGVGLKQSELDELDAIAAESGIARNALMRIAVHRFLDDVRAGRVDLQQYVTVTTSKRLNL